MTKFVLASPSAIENSFEIFHTVFIYISFTDGLFNICQFEIGFK